MKTACAAIAAISPCAKWRNKQGNKHWPDRHRMKHPDIGIAVVGAGRIGTLRARLAAKHPAVRFLAISDRDPERASTLAQAAGADFHSGSNDEVIDHPEVTAVVVSTPEQQHTKPILRALERGKPMLAEKPDGF